MTPPFSFKAAKFCISIYASIEMKQKQAAVTTGVPVGKGVNKKLMYDRQCFSTFRYGGG